MRLWRTIEMAFKALTRNKLRSCLTMLGIVIGVAVVVAMVAIGEGAKHSVQEIIQGLGTNVVMLMPGSSGRGGVHGGFGSKSTLTAEDVEAILEECPSIMAASPVVQTRAQVVSGNKNWNTSIYGVTGDFLIVRNWALSQGTSFGQSDIRRRAKVCMLGKTVAEELFGNDDSYGRSLRINNIPFRIIGVLHPKGGSSWGRDQDDSILIPYTTVQSRLMGIDHLHYAFMSAVSDTAIDRAVEEVTDLLRRRHRIRDDEEDDFMTRTQLEIKERAQAQVGVLSTTFAIVALVSLVVGGIGVMNIMFVSVTERTREIGIRMAVGAKARHILVQFLTEAIVLCLVGGGFGIVGGVGISRLVSQAMEWPSVISISSMFLAVAVSGAIGIFFGFYPARRASRLDPIEALRYE